MRSRDYTLSNKITTCYFDADFTTLKEMVDADNIVLITDENVFEHHHEKFNGYDVITVPPGEKMKTQETADRIIGQLLEIETDKNSLIIGIGGGVITDLAGYIASIYKRGTRLGLVPTTVLGMVDASLGGKNGIDVGVYKNMVGTVYQPEFILYDYTFLNSLPVKEWVNGFAEIIKHACIADKTMFAMLERYNLHQLQNDISLLSSLIERNVEIKMGIVQKDEFENADRRLLNFGHTIGHAIENLHHLDHGHAVSIGMVAACNLSEKINDLDFYEAARVVKLLAHYHLPVDIDTDHAQVYDVLKLDKKRQGDIMHFVLLNSIGDAEARPVPMNYIQENLNLIL